MATTMSSKRETAIEATVDSGALVLRFSNGKALNIGLADISDSIREQAALHGLKQKLVDAAAISRDPVTGRSATIDDKYRAVKTVYDRLLAGQWNAARGEGAVTGGLLFMALSELYPKKSSDELREFLAGKTKAEQAALRKNPRIATIIERIKAEIGADESTDSDAMLDELEE